VTRITSRSREPLVYAAILGLGLAGVCGMWLRLSGRRTSAVEAASAYEDCRQLAAEISRLRARPVRAAFGRGEAKDLTSRLAELAGSTSRGAGLIESIDPEEDTPIGQTAYSTQSTGVGLAPLPLSELVEFLYALQDREPATRVRSISLSLSTGSKQTEGEWTSHLILTRLIYRPITAPPSFSSPAP
jgi:hypothetical protein